MVEWIDYSQNIPLSKVRQEHSAIKDSGELLNAVLAVGVAGHFPPDSCNAMLLPLHQLTLALNFIILEFSFSFNLRPHQCPHPLTVCHRDILSMVEWIDYIQNIPLSKVQQEHSAIKDSGELSHAVLAVGVAGHFPPDSCNAMLLPLHQLTLALNFIILEFSFSFNLRPHQCPHPLTVCHRDILSMVEWIDYIQNIPLSKVQQEHSAIKDSGELSHAVLAVGVAGHFPPDSCNAMLLLLYKLTLPFYNLRVFFFL